MSTEVGGTVFTVGNEYILDQFLCTDIYALQTFHYFCCLPLLGFAISMLRCYYIHLKAAK